jgi:hypothetical protein
MTRYFMFFLFLFLFTSAHANTCPQPSKNSALTLLADDKASRLPGASAQGGIVFSKSLELLGYKTRESQEKFTQLVKSDMKMSADSEVTNFSLYSSRLPERNWMVLKAQDVNVDEYYYYLFQKKGDVYSLTVRTPIDVYSKYCESFPEYYSFDGNDYFSVSGSGGGTGVLITTAFVYQIKNGTAKQVLSYTLAGDNYNEYVLDYESGSITFLSSAFKKTIQIPFTVNYGIPEKLDANSKISPGFKLFDKTFLLNYDWSLFKQAYVLNVNAAKINANIDTEEGLYDLSSDADFLKIYYSELQTIAQKGNPDQRNWLKDFLKRDDLKAMEGSAEMKHLKELLGPE